MRGTGRSVLGAGSAGLAAVSGCNHRVPSTFFEPSLSLGRLRTTPARKPRTECCCQPVAVIIAAIVAPGGDCNIAMTRDCFERVSGLLALGSAVCGAAFAAGTGAGPDIAGRFLADFDITILRSIAAAPHHRSPATAIESAGQDLEAPLAPRN